MTATAAPAYLGNPANVDPEEAFVASLSSCHMLTFLAIACKQKFVLDSYEDEAVGHMEKNADGKMAITRVELRPQIRWHGDRIPSAEELDKMHHSAHENCFIANSVKTDVTTAVYDREAKGDAFAVRPRDMILYREGFSGAVKRSRLKYKSHQVRCHQWGATSEVTPRNAWFVPPASGHCRRGQ
jgi:organic hydroperoxide reductase OsmC/OhrA